MYVQLTLASTSYILPTGRVYCNAVFVKAETEAIPLTFHSHVISQLHFDVLATSGPQLLQHHVQLAQRLMKR